jgi:hypothetical protein
VDGRAEFIIGADTHHDAYAAAALDAGDGLREVLTVPSDAFGGRKLLSFASQHAPARRIWAKEGSGSTEL